MKSSDFVSSTVTSPQYIAVVSEKGPTKVGLSGTEMFVCEKCNRTFKQKSRYEKHLANHPSEKKYLCSFCKKTFTRYPHLQKHLLTHSDERQFVCHECGAAFILQHHLARHKLLHTGARPFECDICEKKFTRKAGLNQHKIIHSGQRPYVCSVENCSRKYTDKTTLRRHILTHTEEKQFICKECEKTFRTKSACRKHYIRHFTPDKSFKCGICEEMFKSKVFLDEHLLIHETKLKNGIFRCGFCLRVFQTQHALDNHVTSHEEKFIFQCQSCDAKFYRNKDLQEHLKVHENSLDENVDSNEEQATSIHTNDINSVETDVTATIDVTTTMPTCNTANNDNNLFMLVQIPNTVTQIHAASDGINGYLTQDPMNKYFLADLNNVASNSNNTGTSFNFATVQQDSNILQDVYSVQMATTMTSDVVTDNLNKSLDCNGSLQFVSPQMGDCPSDAVVTQYANLSDISCNLEVDAGVIRVLETVSQNELGS